MAEGVTYADLRFAKRAPEKGRPAGEAHEEGSDGELTYENFPAASRPRQEGSPGSAQQQEPPGPLARRIRSAAPLALLGACLFLLATSVGLGVRYWQVSRASQRQAGESSALKQRLGGQEENLTRSWQQLSQAQAELDTTWLALSQSWQAGNGTQQRLEEEQKLRKTTEDRLKVVQQEKDYATRELAARSCQQKGCCLLGWTLFQSKCLWVSDAWQNWEGSKSDCERQGARLLVLNPQDARTIWNTAVIPLQSRLQSQEFWVGLRRKMDWNWGWHWVDDTPYAGSQEFYYNGGDCIKMSQRALQREYCSSKHLGYICEKAATPFSGSIDPSA